MPSTLVINSAAETNRVVIIANAGVAANSALTASCRLHDEQLPQSPRPVIARFQFRASSMMSCSAGAL